MQSGSAEIGKATGELKQYDPSSLADGHAEIRLDPGFAATVQTDEYHVFLSEYDGNNALYVTARSATGFEVRAGAGAVDASFSYRVMGKRKDIQAARLEEVELPTPPQI
jgi:ferric-dicitrate binding protein FerR (iron transport regulator)